MSSFLKILLKAKQKVVYVTLLPRDLEKTAYLFYPEVGRHDLVFEILKEREKKGIH